MTPSCFNRRAVIRARVRPRARGSAVSLDRSLVMALRSQKLLPRVGTGRNVVDLPDGVHRPFRHRPHRERTPGTGADSVLGRDSGNGYRLGDPHPLLVRERAPFTATITASAPQAPAADANAPPRAPPRARWGREASPGRRCRP